MANGAARFVLSGIDGTVYTFDQNPETMTLISARSKNEKFEILRGEDIYMRPLLDQEVRRMSWKRTTNAIYTSLSAFATRDANGDIPTSYFWDGTVNEFQGAPIKVLDVFATPIVNDGYGSQNALTLPSEMAWSVDLQFRPVRVA